MGLSRREKMMLGLAGLALALTLGYYLGVKPLLEGSPGLGTGDRHDQMAAQRRLVGKAAAIRARHDGLAEAMAKVGDSFPAETSTDLGGIALLSLVEKIAADAGVTLRAKGLRASGEGETPPRVAVEITGDGDPGAIVRFLHGVRTAPYRLDMERLDLITGEGRTLEIRAVIATLLPQAKGGENRG